ncbi:MAG: VrrA/YqfQ family protein [Bacilli bacterium]
MFNRNSMYQPFSNLYSATPKAHFNWSDLLNNTQKTLSVINQAIPIFYQVKPIWNNAKTMFKVMGEMGKINNSHPNTTNQNNSTKMADNNQTSYAQNKDNEPTFFI